MIASRNGRCVSNFILIGAFLAPVSSWAGQIVVERQQLIANDGAKGDRFGFSVDVSGTTALVSTFRDNDAIPGDEDSGWVYAFQKDDRGLWSRSTKLIAADAPLGNGFGYSVAISGRTAIIGALNDGDRGWQSGAAYIFEHDQANGWIQVAKVTASDTTEFGNCVDISDDTAIVGSPDAAYVFRRSDYGGWNEVARLIGNDSTRSTNGGVAISGSTVVLGKPGGAEPGAAYVFREDVMGNWAQVAKLSANNADAYNSFGESVSISGKRIIVAGERPPNSGIGRRSSAAYIFEEDHAGTWQNVFSFVADAPSEERAHKSVVIDGDLAIVGVPRDDLGYYHTHGLLDYGSAYVFKREAETWSQIGHEVPKQLVGQQFFGMSVAIDGNTVFIGAFGEDGVVPDSGAAYAMLIVPEPSGIILAVMAMACKLRRRSRR